MEEGRISEQGFGRYLARERNLRNIRLEEIAAKTRISFQVLQALEADQWEKLPPKVYLKGFIRAYARHIGLDENEALLRFEDYLQGLELLPTLTVKKARRPLRTLLWPVLFVVALALIYILWWRPFHQPHSTDTPHPSPDLPLTGPPTGEEKSNVSPAPSPDSKP